MAFHKIGLKINDAWYAHAWWLNLLRPLSWLYEKVRRRRERAYTQAIKLPQRTRLAVIVVGNITVGGTGKTPLVGWIIAELKAQGFNPGIVMRGYGGTLSKVGALVPLNANPTNYGDEAVQARSRLNCPVAIAAERVKALHLLESEGCDIAIADDGLQHYAMARDIEIVVVDGKRGIGNGYLLPAGPLREPVTRLETVDLVVANGAPTTLVNDAIQMHVVADAFINMDSGQKQSCAQFSEMLKKHQEIDNRINTNTLTGEVHAVCGIGNPARFWTTLSELDIYPKQHEFGDHYEFSRQDIEFGEDAILICTEKDAAKIRLLEGDLQHVWYLQISAELADDARKKLTTLLNKRAIYPRRVASDTR